MPLLLDAPLTPRGRRDGAEVLDDPGCDPALRTRSLTDVVRANTVLGGRRAVLAELRAAMPALRALGRPATLLDVGTGLGDIPRAAQALAARAGVTMHTIGLDEAASLARASVRTGAHAVCGDARALPFATASVDVVTCSQLLHHFGAEDVVAIVREMHRVARVRVIVSDLRRSWVAAIGFWVVSFPMLFHPVSRADGMLSVLKGFTAGELGALIERATDVRPLVHHRVGWRLTAGWTPEHRA